MGEALRFLISGNPPSDRHGFPLRIGSHRCPRVTGTLDLPATLGVGRSMLVFTHVVLLIHEADPADHRACKDPGLSERTSPRNG